MLLESEAKVGTAYGGCNVYAIAMAGATIEGVLRVSHDITVHLSGRARHVCSLPLSTICHETQMERMTGCMGPVTGIRWTAELRRRFQFWDTK